MQVVVLTARFGMYVQARPLFLKNTRESLLSFYFQVKVVIFALEQLVPFLRPFFRVTNSALLREA